MGHGLSTLVLCRQMASVFSLCILASLYYFKVFQNEVTFAILASSALAFTLYGLDKFAACNRFRRIPETLLHLLSIIGGWPGAVIGQQVFNHKTRKTKFQITFWLTASVNCVILGVII